MPKYRRRIVQGVIALGCGIGALLYSPADAEAAEPLACADICIDSCSDYNTQYCAPCFRETFCISGGGGGVGPCGAGAVLGCNWDS